MDKNRLEEIRKSEALSHVEIYTSHTLYEAGSWLSKPIKTVKDILPLFCEYKKLSVLDLGCGVGRNAIYIADTFENIACTIDCVDILPLAIEKLDDYAKKYEVTSAVNGIVKSIEEYQIEKNKYDFILAISALEHIDTIEAFKNKLIEIKEGIRENGIVCFVINTEVEEQNLSTSEQMLPQFEVNLPTSEVLIMLTETFDGWEVTKKSIVEQCYETPRQDVVSRMKTNVVTFVARKEMGKSDA